MIDSTVYSFVIALVGQFMVRCVVDHYDMSMTDLMGTNVATFWNFTLYIHCMNMCINTVPLNVAL